ncbi:uncharacterized protein LOC134256435 [Saccostrea cucullata]|uniref:uncharacterized protein LOC134256435 n=1 Tax=Saccostrea cuccullata TaxID=36930 RepID=UPI002ED312FB
MSLLSIDECRTRIIRDNLVKLIHCLCPRELLPHLTCLSTTTKQKIRCRLDNEGQVSASDLLLQELQRKDRWWEQLIAALRHSEVDMDNIADLLEADLESLSELHGKERGKHAYKTEKSKRKERIDWSTPLDKLPYPVLNVLKRLDVGSKWKDLAAHLGYTVEQVERFEVYADKDGSHATKFYSDLAKNRAFDLGRLVCVLKEIERNDILEDLRHLKELSHLDWNTTKYPHDVTTIARQESCQQIYLEESTLCFASWNSNSIPTDVSSGSNGSHAMKDERHYDSGVILGGTQLMSLDPSPAVDGPAQSYGDNDQCCERIALNHEADELCSDVTTQDCHINEYFENNNDPPKGNTEPFTEDCTTNEDLPKTEPRRQQQVGNTVLFSAPSCNLSKTVIGFAATAMVAFFLVKSTR